MENQHRKISGYRELTQVEIDLMNEIKAFGPQLQALCEKVHAHITQQRDHALHLRAHENDPSECERLEAATPLLWSERGELELKVGLMALTRAVAQPTFF